MTVPERRKVLLDMSPLDTPSRLRGIGQYIMGLANGIRELQAQSDLGFDIEGLAHFDASGQTTGVDSLTYEGTPLHPDGFDNKGYAKRKISGISPAARARGGHLIHVTEPGALIHNQGVPLLLTCYDLIPLVMYREYLGKAPWTRIFRERKDRKYFGSARRIAAISKATKRDLVEHLGIDDSIVDITYLGADHVRFTPQPIAEHERESLMLRHGLNRPFLLYIGAYDARKNIPLLIRAFAAANLGKDFDLVLAGAIRDCDRTRLTALASQCNVASTTRIIGFVEEADVAPFYRSCHLHVFPSSYEGFGLPVAEAMACGAPTIAADASSIPEVAGKAAFLVPPNDEQAFCSAIRSLAYDETQRSLLRSEGPKQAAQFQWLECAKQTLEAYRKALSMA